MLLAKNAYVNSKTKAGWTPLHFVAFKGFNEMISPLVSKHNAAIDATSMVSFSRPTARSAEGLLLMESVCVCILLSHISRPVIGQRGS